VRLNPVPEYNSNSVNNFLVSIKELFEHARQDVTDDDTVGVAIYKEVNYNDSSIGRSIRRRNLLSSDVIYNVFEVARSNARFSALDAIIVMERAVRLPVGSVVLTLKEVYFRQWSN
jgi:hypothetical protein